MTKQVSTPILINTPETLSHYCDKWLSHRALAIDTEFIRTQTYFPIPALLQVFDGNHCYLIDPLCIKHFTPLQAVFENKNIIKILHSCSEDLEVFAQIPSALPSPLFDTQLAAGFAGHGFSIGYGRLVNTLFNVELPKEETRSDWLQRPLSDKQIEYACLDVIYLYQLFEHLEATLENTCKINWFQEECKNLLKLAGQSRSPEYILSRLKNAWKLPLNEQKHLKALCLWREQIARSRNKPRNHVLKESTLYSLARQQPQSREALSAIDELSHNQRKEYGAELLKIFEVDRSIDTTSKTLFPQPLPKEFTPLVKKLKQAINQIAETENIAPEIIARKKDIDALVNSFINHGAFELPDSLKGWRKELIGNLLLNICQQDNLACRN